MIIDEATSYRDAAVGYWYEKDGYVEEPRRNMEYYAKQRKEYMLNALLEKLMPPYTAAQTLRQYLLSTTAAVTLSTHCPEVLRGGKTSDLRSPS